MQKRESDAPQLWMGSSPLIDLTDPRLKKLVNKLVFGHGDERSRVLALYRHVRQIPLAADRQWWPMRLGRVLDLRQCSAWDKTTLFVAMLRCAGVPARVVFAAPWHESLQGLPVDICCGLRPVVEVHTDQKWVRTDTYIFDDKYLMAARARLQKKRQEHGYGVSVSGATDWDAMRYCYVLGTDHEDHIADAAPRYDDVAQFLRDRSPLARLAFLATLLRWNTKAGELQRVLGLLRARVAPEREAGSRRAGKRKPRAQRPDAASAPIVRHADSRP